MSYTKLYSSILDSSIWSASESTRLVWVTMLAMATKNGIVHASVDGLARRANVPIDRVQRAVEELSAPDPHDKSGVRDGRRIVPMQGCWQLVNFEFYRETRSIDAVRKQQWRDRSASKKVDVLDNAPSSSSSSSSSSAPAPEGVDPPAPSAKLARFAPDDFTPNDTHRFRCTELRLDIAKELREFRLQEFNRGYSNWDKRFSKWLEDSKLRRETEAAKPPKTPPKPKRPGEGVRLADVDIP